MKRREFGATWWGRAWIDALEQRARLDPNRLPRGRTYARQQKVGALTVRAGAIEAPVQGSRARPYRVTIRVREFTEDEWVRVIDAIAGRAAHAAALLDGELLPEVLADADAVGVDLLPGAGELGLTCSCPDWAVPCKHAAAVCYLMADVLDEDPFALFLVRGRGREELWAALRERRRFLSPAAVGSPDDEAEPRSGASASATPATNGRRGAPGSVAARAAWAHDQPRAEDLWALPGPPPPHRPGHPAPLAVNPPAASGIAADDLLALGSDAAARAWALGRGESDGDLALTLERDLARRAAALLGTRRFAQLVDRADLPSRHLVRHALAWRHGGEEGFEVLTETWTPEPDQLEEGRAALLASSAGTLRTGSSYHRPIKQRANTLILDTVQLRLSRQGNWFRLGKTAGHWEVEDGPAADPTALFVTT